MANDIQLSARSSNALATSLPDYQKEFLREKQRLQQRYGLIVVKIATPFLFAFFAIRHDLVALTSLAQSTLVDESFVMQRFTAIYEQVVAQIPSKHAAEEHAAMVDQATRHLQKQQLSLQCLREEAGSRGFLNDEFKAECAELQEKFASLSTRSKMMQAIA